jgi:hypothetical protein
VEEEEAEEEEEEVMAVKGATSTISILPPSVAAAGLFPSTQG